MQPVIKNISQNYYCIGDWRVQTKGQTLFSQMWRLGVNLQHCSTSVGLLTASMPPCVHWREEDLHWRTTAGLKRRLKIKMCPGKFPDLPGATSTEREETFTRTLQSEAGLQFEVHWIMQSRMQHTAGNGGLKLNVLWRNIGLRRLPVNKMKFSQKSQPTCLKICIFSQTSASMMHVSLPSLIFALSRRVPPLSSCSRFLPVKSNFFTCYVKTPEIKTDAVNIKVAQIKPFKCTFYY